MPMDNILPSIYQFGFIFIFIIVFSLKIPLKNQLIFSLFLLSFYTFLTLNLSFKHTDFGYGGYGGDMSFLTAYVTKFANFKGFIDFGYKNLGSFYPPLYYYFLGKISAVFSIEPYKMLKYGMLSACFICPFISLWSWKKITGLKTAIILSFSILLYQDWHKINAWLALILFIPWWLYYIDNIFNKNFTRKDIIKGGITGGIIIMLQYYWILIGLLFLIIKYAINFYKNRSISLNHLKKDLYNKALFAILAVFAAGLYIFPYGYELLFHKSQPLQNNYFSISMMYLPFDLLKSFIPGILYITSIAYLFYKSANDKLSYNLLILFIAVLIFCSIGNFMVWLSVPILHFKSHYLLRYLLSVIFFYSISDLLFNKIFAPQKQYNYQFKTTAFLLSVSLLVFLSQHYYRNKINISSKKDEETYHYPHQKINDIKALTNNNYKGNVYLFDHDIPLIFLPLYTFVMWNAHYSHPLALHSERVDFLRKISVLEHPVFFNYALKNNIFDNTNGILFENKANNTLTLTKDNFPHGLKNHKIKIDPSLANSPLIDKKVGDIYEFWKLKKSNPDFNNYINFNTRKLASLYILSTLLKKECDLPKRLNQDKIVKTFNKRLKSAKKENEKYANTLLALLNGEAIEPILSPSIKNTILNKNISLKLSDFKTPLSKIHNNKIIVDSTKSGNICFYGNYQNLPKGKYKVIIHYHTAKSGSNWDIVSQYARNRLYKGPLAPNKTMQSAIININHNHEGKNLEIRGKYSGKGKLKIDRILITPLKLH